MGSFIINISLSDEALHLNLTLSSALSPAIVQFFSVHMSSTFCPLNSITEKHQLKTSKNDRSAMDGSQQ